MSWIRLRQIAVVARDLDATVAAFHDTLALDVAFRDPAVGAFGLVNAVMPLGNQFVEVVSPTRDGTAGGRQLDRLGGDGGYMVICHTDDHAAVRDRVAELGVRTALDTVDHGYHIFQLHPADTGGSFLEIDFQPGGDDLDGPWAPAGPDWQSARCTEVVSAITAVEVTSRDRAATIARWSAITGIEPSDGALRLDNATVVFADGDVDALVAVTLEATDRNRVGEHHVLGGVRFTFA